MTPVTAILADDSLAHGRRRFQRYSETSDSAIPFVRRLPSHWRVEKLKHVASVRFSSVDKKTEEGESPVRLCNYTDVYNRDTIVDDPEFMQASASAAEIARHTLKKGDVLITKDSEEWNDIAVPAYVSADMPGVLCGYHMAHIRPNPAELDGEFLSRAFTADGIRQQFHIAANGITRYGLPNRAIAGSLFPIPPLDEQRAITAFLNCETEKIDDLIAKKEQFILLAENRRASLMTAVVTRGIPNKVDSQLSNGEAGKSRKPNWLILPFRRVITGIEQGWSPQADQRLAEGDEWAVLKVGAVYKGRFRPEEHKALTPGLEPETRFEVHEGDLLLTRGNTPELVADACVIPNAPHRLMMSDLHYRLSLDERRLLKRFACYWLLSRAGRSQIEADAHGTSNSMVKVSQRHIRSWSIPIPSLAEQEQIISLLDNEDRSTHDLVSRITAGIARLRKYRSALISNTTIGQIDVRNYRPEAPCQ